ncbi:MFS transporter [Sphaerisporangium fuscum]|uniref:MFS transporter n=1 Tax=Sphaerisporangium fuscum TaxID=2835868 RepID=UPI001BDCB331|nr:MFS transporter [Sphaerisporangium fuscum]
MSLLLKTPPLLRQRDFRRFWTAQTVSYLGDQVTVVALPLVAVLALHASAAELGYLTAAASLPNLLLGLHAGALADRGGSRRAMMVATDLARMVLLLSVPVAFTLGWLTSAQLYAVAFLTGALALLFNVSSASLFPALVPRDRFVQGNSLLRGSFSFSWVAGPSAAGLIVQVISAPVALVLDAVSFLASALLLGSIGREEPRQDESRHGGGVRAGLRYLLASPVLRARTLSGAVLNFSYTAYFTLLFLFAARELHLSPGMIGFAIGAGAVGALVGAVVAPRLSGRMGVGPALIAGAVAYPGALLLVPLAPGDAPWLAVAVIAAAEFVSGAGLMLDDIAGASIQQAVTPQGMLGRVSGAHMTLSSGARPLGALAAGALGTWMGLGPTIALAAVVGLLSAGFLLASPIPRMRDLPEQSPGD